MIYCTHCDFTTHDEIEAYSHAFLAHNIGRGYGPTRAMQHRPASRFYVISVWSLAFITGGMVLAIVAALAIAALQ